MSRIDWCDLPGPGRDQPRVVQRVHDPGVLARLVVDLLVRARGEERRERVRDGKQPVSGKAGRRRDHVLLRDPALDEPVRKGELECADAAVRGEVGVEDDELLVLGAEPDELLAVGIDDVLVRDLRAACACTRLGLALERLDPRGVVLRGDRLEPEGLEAVQLSSRSPIRDAISANARSKASSSGAPACQR